MADLIETVQWEATIYQLETTDPVKGGTDGISNRQAKQLANRTAYLKQQVELKAPLASPTFTGTPNVPTADADTSTKQAASTEFVIGQAATDAPAMDGVADVGTSKKFARQDHVHPKDTSKVSISDLQSGAIALGNRAGAFTYSSATSLVMDMTYAGKLILFNGATAQSAVLPLSTSVGTSIEIACAQAYGLTITSSGTATNIDTYYGLVSSVVMQQGDTAIFTYTSGGTWVCSGVATFRQREFSASKAANGYQKLPSGLIIQWGSAVVTSGVANVTFPIAFPNAVFNCFPVSGLNMAAPYAVTSQSLTGCAFPFYNSSTGAVSGSGFNCIWFAIGY